MLLLRWKLNTFQCISLFVLYNKGETENGHAYNILYTHTRIYII